MRRKLADAGVVGAERSWRLAARLGLAAASLAALALVGSPAAAASLFGSDQSGNLVSIDTSTGAGTLIGTEVEFPLATEIEFDLSTGTLYSEEVDGFTNLHTLDPATGLSTGFVPHGCCALTGLEFVGSTLYATNIMGGGAPSTLEIVDPTTGTLTPIGPTGLGPISGLAYDTSSSTMFGVTAGGGLAELVTVDLVTGLATPIALLVDTDSGAALASVGSIEFGSDGVLYGGMGLSAGLNPGWLFSIDPATGASSFIGPTGLEGITGLTNPIPEPSTALLLGLGLLGLSARRRRAEARRGKRNEIP